jgi:3-deoxy-D-manno-octulosonic-acid transferase
VNLIETAYGALLGVFRVLSPLLGVLRPGHAADLAERRNAPGLMALWARAARQADRPLLWLHGPSAGELLGAEPVLATLRRELDLQLCVTFTSGSARPAVDRLQPDFAGLAPVDSPRQCRSAIAALEPSAIVFAKLDVWPGLTGAAVALGVPIGLINGTVRPDSSRLRPLARRLLRPAYARLQRAGAATATDRERLLALGVRSEACTVTGDAAFDLVLDRVAKARASASSAHRLLERRAGQTPDETTDAEMPLRIVAGSTWPEDEALLLGAAAELRQDAFPFELILVPHQPTASAVDRLRHRCREILNEEPDLWTRIASGRSSGAPLIVDVVGPLAELYLAADVAYVGGGLGDTGLHSVIEPAAAGVPVVFGPRHSRREASELLTRGAAREIDATSAAAVLRELSGRPDVRRRMGELARTYVGEGAGAASAGADLIAGLIAS